MDLRKLLLGVGILLIPVTGYAKPIYKCQVNGAVVFTEEKCDSNAKPVELKGLAAPLEPFDMDKLRGMDEKVRARMIEDRIALRQKRIRTYRNRMQSELKQLQAKINKKTQRNKSQSRNSIQEKEINAQLKSIADNVELDTKGTLPDQMNAVVARYKTLIEAEQFQIELLLQELRVNQMMHQNTSRNP
ncbi:hypothetical protein [Endozoicomonas sp. 8E]|uniref:hypothetical protein n=1 Tax=Endozoicomonas sp. 8E TaxID=3035692 RepID=UPI002938FC3A|nr:hypothetical protein [Endozoicomonas sp. 8E]WOG27542.1 hypothetical protein P6910_23835 [Endozoicomonas sp. 8E]